MNEEFMHMSFAELCEEIRLLREEQVYLWQKIGMLEDSDGCSCNNLSIEVPKNAKPGRPKKLKELVK